MKTKLISLTKPMVTDVILTPEEFIVYIARVSNPSNQLNTETGAKLLNYLVKHKHWSPFEHVSCTFEIVTSRAIAAQILRHRSFTFQEFSQRYAHITKTEPLEFRLQGKTNRQVGDDPIQIDSELLGEIDAIQDRAIDLYVTLIEKGVAKECARMILPLNTQTTIYMTGTLRSWLHYLDLRCAQSTQKEHRDIAVEINNTLKDIFPQTFSALDQQVSH